MKSKQICGVCNQPATCPCHQQEQKCPIHDYMVHTDKADCNCELKCVKPDPQPKKQKCDDIMCDGWGSCPHNKDPQPIQEWEEEFNKLWIADNSKEMIMEFIQQTIDTAVKQERGELIKWAMVRFWWEEKATTTIKCVE